jgi:hypothetical protein
VRLVVAVAGGWLVLRATGSLQGLFIASAAAMLLYGVITLTAVTRGAWSALDRGLDPR